MWGKNQLGEDLGKIKGVELKFRGGFGQKSQA